MVCDRFPHSNCRALAKAPSLEQAEPTCRKMPYLLRPRSSKESTTCRCSTVASCHIFVASPMVHGWNYQTSLAFTLHKFKFKNGSEFNSHPSPIQLRLWLLAELFGCWHFARISAVRAMLVAARRETSCFPQCSCRDQKRMSSIYTEHRLFMMICWNWFNYSTQVKL